MRRIFVIFTICMLLFPNLLVEAKSKQEDEIIKITVQTKKSSQYETTMTLKSRYILKNVHNKQYMKTLNYSPISDVYLIHMENNVTKEYLIDDQFNLFDLHTKKLYELSKNFKLDLKKYVKQLRKKHYGKLLPWQNVTQHIPKYSKFEIIDLDTGLRFNVQRRAGSHHADVQPLAKNDTEIMKKIYNGKWSWKRRAILINHNNETIAASMHGMPHGQGALVNEFPGHFCVHFHLSKTHTRNSVDFSHKIMTYKAAGKMKEFHNKITPYDLIDSFIFSIHQNDLPILKMTATINQYAVVEKIFEKLNDVHTMKRISSFSTNNDIEQNLFLLIPVEVQIEREYQFEKKMMQFFLYRPSLVDSWKIEMKSVFEQIE